MNKFKLSAINVSFVLDKDGKITQVSILSQVPNEFGVKLIDELSKISTLKPATYDNIPVSRKHRITYGFSTERSFYDWLSFSTETFGRFWIDEKKK